MTRTIQQAAGQIVALINSRPASPSEAEIAKIIVRIGATAAPMSPEHAAHYREWRRLIEEHVREFCGPDPDTKAEIEGLEKRMAAHMDMIDEFACRILATPAQTWGDVLLYAQVCFWTNWPGTDPEGPDAQAEMDAGFSSMGGLCDASIIKLIEAIVAVAGGWSPRP